MQQESEFGDFEEVKEKETGKSKGGQEQQIPQRIRMPRGKELIGVIFQRLGGNRMEIKATDGKLRNCRVPGRYRRRLWLRPRDVVIIVPWELDDNKADIIYKYQKIAAKQLKKQGILDNIKEEF